MSVNSGSVDRAWWHAISTIYQ